MVTHDIQKYISRKMAEVHIPWFQESLENSKKKKKYYVKLKDTKDILQIIISVIRQNIGHDDL